MERRHLLLLVFVIFIVIMITIIILYGNNRKQEPRASVNVDHGNQCNLDGDCPGANTCVNGFCEPGYSNNHICVKTRWTGNGKVNVFPTDIGTNPYPGQDCFFFVGTEGREIITARFEMFWTDSDVPAGGYILTWGPVGVQYGRIPLTFDANLALIPHARYKSDGDGFGIQRAGSIVCDDENPQRCHTTFIVTPVGVWQACTGINFVRNGNDVDIEWDEIPTIEEYVFSVKIERKQTVDPNGAAYVYPVTYAYHGDYANNTGNASITLPDYFINNNDLFNEYGDIEEVLVYGFKSCNIGGPAATYQRGFL